MRAVTVRGHGLAIEEADEPRAGADEAVVAVEAVSLNNGEVRHALGEAEDGYRPGWDVAGRIVVAPAGSGLAAAQRVVGLTFAGGWAERVAIPLRQLAPIPDAVSADAASTLPVAALTAAVALTKQPLRPSGRVLVTAATGGVGLYAIQLAAQAGWHVTAFVRDAADGARLRALGADAIAAGTAEAAAAEPFDLILEGVGGDLLGRALVWMKPRGVCVLFGDAAGARETRFDSWRFRLGNGAPLFGGTTLYGFFLLEELTRPDPVAAPPLLAKLAGRLAAGTLDPCIGRTASWRDADAVARALVAREFPGKAVLRID